MKLQILLVVFGFVAASSAAPSKEAESAEESFVLDSSVEKQLEQNTKDMLHDLGVSDSDVEEFMKEVDANRHRIGQFFDHLASKLKDLNPKALRAAGDILEGGLDEVEAEMDEVEEALDEAEKMADEGEDESDNVEETADEAEALSDVVSDDQNSED